MVDRFITIAITSPLFFEDESKIITNILREKKSDLVHLRKPTATCDELEKLINEIPSDLHNHLKLHDHFKLIDKYKIAGIHLNSRNPSPYPGAKNISISIHSLDEINGADDFDYFMISPIFDSISKKGYKAGFNLRELSEKIKNKKAVALGGVTPDKFPLLKSLGFYGGAMQGFFFSNINHQ